MQRGEATLPTATPSQTCPSCCTSLPTGSQPTGIPQQSQRSRWQRAVNLSLPFAVPRGCCLFPRHLLLPLGSVEQDLLGTHQVGAMQRSPGTGDTPTAGRNPQAGV